MTETWTEISRPEMFERVITAVDDARCAAIEEGDERYADYVEEVLFPFLESELGEARQG